MVSTIHCEWLKRNDWAFDANYGDPSLAVPFDQLSKEEQDNDRAQLLSAQAKIQADNDGIIDGESICEQYGLSIYQNQNSENCFYDIYYKYCEY